MALLMSANDSFLIRGATVHTVTHGDIVNGAVLVRDGKISGVGVNLTAPKDIKVIDARGMHVYPGLIDAATQIGLVEVNGVRESVDLVELGRLNPQLVALSAVNPSSEHIAVTRANGITMAATVPEGALISGQVSLLHLAGWTTDEMGVKARAAVHLRMPMMQGVTRTVLDDEMAGGPAPRIPYSELKKAFDRQMAELNEFFESARQYQKSKQAADLKLEAMIPVLEGREPLLITALRAREIRAAIAFGVAQRIRIIICDAPEAYKVAKELKEHDVPVILGPTFSLPMDEDDAYDAPYTNAAALDKAGVRFAFGTMAGKANLASRNLPYQAAQSVAFGLGHDAAIRALTESAAQIWGMDSQTGSIEEGKWADLQVTDGDPLEARTQVRQLFIQGKAVDMNTRQKELYLKYLNRP